jgi:predicted transcriptional regulator
MSMAGMESEQAGQDDVVLKKRVLKPVCSVHLIRELRGMPFCILMVLVSTGCGPISLVRLARISGFSEKSVRNALYALFEFGFVIQTRVGWVLIDRNRQLDLEALADGDTDEMEFEVVNPPNSDGDYQIGKNSLPPISINNKAFKDSINYDNTNKSHLDK